MLLTVLSFNIHKGFGWHRLRSTFHAINDHIHALNPDIIFFQEILGAQAEYITSDMWPHYSYGKNVVYPKGHFGNAIFSKLPILFTENFDLSTYRFDKRGLLHSIVQLPDGRYLHLLCVHLGLLQKSRQKQYEKIIHYIHNIIKEDEPIILGGDFNDWGSQATHILIEALKLHEAFTVFEGSHAKTFPAWKPFLKLDRIYTRGMTIINAQCMTEKSWRQLSDHVAIKVIVEL